MSYWMMGVRNINRMLVVLILQLEHNFDMAFVSKLKCIADKVHQNLLDPFWIWVNLLGHRFIDHMEYFELFYFSLFFEQKDNIVQKIFDVELLAFDAQLVVVVELGQILDVFYHGEKELEAYVKVL